MWVGFQTTWDYGHFARKALKAGHGVWEKIKMNKINGAFSA